MDLFTLLQWAALILSNAYVRTMLDQVSHYVFADKQRQAEAVAFLGQYFPFKKTEKETFDRHFFVPGDLIYRYILSEQLGQCEDLPHLRDAIFNRFLDTTIDEDNNRPVFETKVGFSTPKFPVEPYAQEKIPRRVHYLWLTEGLSPKPFKPTFMKQLRVNKEILESRGTEFEFHFWLNDKAFQFEAMTSELKEMGFIIHSIEEFGFINGHCNYKTMEALRLQLAQLNFGAASDFVRLLALKEFGGIYLDLDNALHNNFDFLLHFDFFTGDTFLGQGSGFLGAIPSHPIVIESLKMATEIVTSEELLPKRICYNPCDLQHYYASARVIGTAYMLHQGMGTRDIQLTENVFDDRQTCKAKAECKPAFYPWSKPADFLECFSFQEHEISWCHNF